jgi:hypothetical protein
MRKYGRVEAAGRPGSEDLLVLLRGELSVNLALGQRR